MKLTVTATIALLALPALARAEGVERTLRLPPTERFYPLHAGSGDLDFSANGPLVKIRATLTARESCLDLGITMRMRETKPDWTEGRLEVVDRQVWCDPGGARVLAIATPAVADGGYSDTDHEIDTVVPGVGEVDARRQLPGNPSFVRSFMVMGDTGDDLLNTADEGGKDVGPVRRDDGTMAQVFRSSLQVQFNPIVVRLEEGPAPAPTASAGVAPRPREIELPGLATSFFVPPKTAGDGDFGGHGPRVRVGVTLRVLAGSRLVADVSMKATETGGDGTAAEGTASSVLWTAPPTWRINGILGHTTSSASYVDRDWDHDFLLDPAGEAPRDEDGFEKDALDARKTAGAPTAVFHVVGDLDGGDAGTRSGVQVFFLPIKLSVSPIAARLAREEELRPKVLLDVPSGDYTNRMSGGNSCGPSAASRVLRFYGVDTTYEQFKRRVQSSGNFVSDQSLGTPPGTLRDRLNDMKSGFVHQVLPLGGEAKNQSAYDRIVHLLDQGKPVIAMIGWGGQNVRDVFSPHDAASMLHWIVVRGHDPRAQTLYVLDNGHPVVWNRETFLSLFDYGQDAQFEALVAMMDVQKGSIIYRGR